MKERQVMEKNLAKLLKQIDYKSCGSDSYEEVQDNPVNPFRKRVFEKKLRSSSVASISQNVNPNSSVTHNTTYEQNQYSKVQSIIQRGRNCLQRLERNVIEQIQKSTKFHSRRKSNQSSNKILQNLSNSIEFIQQYILKRHPGSSLQNISINYIQNYQCYNSVQQNIMTQKKQKKLKSIQKQSKYKNMSGLRGSKMSQNTNSKSGPYRSVYQSVLEQRKYKKIKNSRIV